MVQSTPNSGTGKINSTVLGFLASLALKGGVDTLFHDVPGGVDFQAVWASIGITPLLLFAVFFFTILRFLYGAYRFHEESDDSEASEGWMPLWNVVGALVLFVAFYVCGLCVKHPNNFFLMLIAVHVVDVIWFSGSLFFRPPQKLAKLMRNFIIIDLLTCLLLWMITYTYALRSINGDRLTDWGVVVMLVFGVSDAVINRDFFFHPEKWRNTMENTKSKTKRVYFAGPLFTQGEWQWNLGVATALRAKGLEVFLPQEAVEGMLAGTEAFNADAIYNRNKDEIDRADIVVAILDQADPDSGTSWECGYATKAGKPVIGVRTDIRKTGDGPSEGVNIMLSKSCRNMVTADISTASATGTLVDSIVRAIEG